MTVDVLLYPVAANAGFLDGKIAVVIDVLRSSSTLAKALSNGAEAVFPFVTPEEAIGRRKDAERASVLLCGERGGKKIPGFNLGNSPAEFSAKRVQGKILFFSSTNGSKAILTASLRAREVLVGGFNNAAAAVSRLIRNKKNCVLVCAGQEGGFSLEDAVCAGMLAARIRAATMEACLFSDAASASVLLYNHYKDGLVEMMHACEHGRALKRVGMESDLGPCAEIDSLHVLPVLQGGALRLAEP